MSILLESIVGADPALRNGAFHGLCGKMTGSQLIAACEELDAFRRSADNLYERVRASLYLYAAYRFHLQESSEFPRTGKAPYAGFQDLLARRFDEAIDRFLGAMRVDGPNASLFSALADAYHQLTFQTLNDQVRRSVRSSRGNQWMFRVGHADDHPVRLRSEMRTRESGALLFPVLCETTPVRLDLSHSGWSDIFFLGMDYPEGARVLNISVDLAVYGRDRDTQPPIESYIRVITEPLLRLTSVDLDTTKDITELQDLFNFGNDYLSLVKAAVIASGLIPPSFEGTQHPLANILARVVGPGMGLEIVTKVNDIPKGSRLAVSTNLLASVIGALMRATGQTESMEGSLSEEERRIVASRAILGEWLGGSGGGWQDSGGVWPGFKVIEGAVARECDPEYGVSRGCLLPRHRLLGEADLHPEIRERLAASLVLLHGGMAQNVGPILEMVTEKYLLRAAAEWDARLAMRGILDGILQALKEGDIKALGAWTMRNWSGPLKTIIPWVTNRFTEAIIKQAADELGEDFWGFLMLGGMSGGGMAMFVDPRRREAFRERLLLIMGETKRQLEDALPFAMDPVVYDFAINSVGTSARLLHGEEAIMPSRYYALQIPELVRQGADKVAYLRRAELDHFTTRPHGTQETYGLLRTLVGNLFRVSDPATRTARQAWDAETERIKTENGFDVVQHEQTRNDLRAGRIGLAHNRLPIQVSIEDVRDDEVTVACRRCEVPRDRRESTLRGARGGHVPGGRDRESLDFRRGRYQGGESLRVACRSAPQLSRDSCRQDAAHGRTIRRARAAHRVHQLPYPCAG